MGWLTFGVKLLTVMPTKTVFKGIGKGFASLTAGLSDDAAKATMVAVPIPSVGASIPWKGARVGYTSPEALSITYGSANYVTGPGGRTLQTLEKESNIDDTSHDTSGRRAMAGIVSEEAALGLASSYFSTPGLRPGLSTYAKASGGLLAADAITYGVTEGLSRTEFGQEHGFEDGMTFNEMNFKTGENLGQAALNVQIGDDGETINQRTWNMNQEAMASDAGGDLNPWNYWKQSENVGDVGLGTATYLVHNVVEKPLGFFGLLR